MLKRLGSLLAFLIFLAAAVIKILEYAQINPTMFGSTVATLAKATVSAPVVTMVALLGGAFGYILACLFHPLRLRIIAASYGVGNDTADVTTFVRKQINRDRLSFVVNNDNLGSDPCLGQQKNLDVTYRVWNGQISKSFREYSRIELPE
jgi:hypothetical protein